MKKLILILFIGALVFLAATNPTQDDFNAYLKESVASEKTEVKGKLALQFGKKYLIFASIYTVNNKVKALGIAGRFIDMSEPGDETAQTRAKIKKAFDKKALESKK